MKGNDTPPISAKAGINSTVATQPHDHEIISSGRIDNTGHHYFPVILNGYITRPVIGTEGGNKFSRIAKAGIRSAVRMVTENHNLVNSTGCNGSCLQYFSIRLNGNWQWRPCVTHKTR